eukprot:GEMP01111956.1.p1 GENE.GEMP01111956.1~~GEMP01111956.1.p1  ORF type:complete len:193 (-),score=47.91 GEMP01111956.1:84-662(-)
MEAVKRLDQFIQDGEASLKTNNIAKVQSELKRFRNWLHKHQDEALPDAGKTKFQQIVQLYVGFATKPEGTAMHDDARGLLEDCLKIPEGKLVSSKAKKPWIKAAESFREASVNANPTEAASVKEYLVIDCTSEGEKKKKVHFLSVMHSDGGDSFSLRCPAAMAMKVSESLEEGTSITVIVRGDEPVDIKVER